ncbi:hypothetical protein DQ239_04830 [Blastococcus sp. TF02-09]|uniref:AAA family ATPase n=1 Tax=Blastococcus sp. TF02-09 TaxID=2250576 RepID=UPI000DE867F3|nr:AAA family ATPase [Blastococcus sp. TF02-9]RBY80376.1 hypothetical protein DQ239_04830 [Blastococcus sp. TF02-9]
MGELSRIVLVTGMPGSGKSTVSAELAARDPEVLVVEVGRRMAELATDMGIISGYAALPMLPAPIRAQLQAAAVESFASASASRILVVAHLQVKGPEGLVPGFPAGILESLDPSAIVLIEAEGRLGSTGLVPGLSTATYRELAIATAKRLRVPLLVLENSGGLAECADRMQALLNNLAV